MKLNELMTGLTTPAYNTGVSVDVPTLLIELGTPLPIAKSTPDFDQQCSKQIGTMDGLPVWASHCFGPEYLVIGFLVNNNIPAYIALSVTEYKGAYPLVRMETLQHSAPGMIQALLQFCLRKMKWKIVVTKDEPLTQSGWNFLVRSVERGILTTIDTTTLQSVTAEQLKAACKQQTTDVEVFLEGQHMKYEHIVCNQPDMMAEVVYYIGDKLLQ